MRKLTTIAVCLLTLANISTALADAPVLSIEKVVAGMALLDKECSASEREVATSAEIITGEQANHGVNGYIGAKDADFYVVLHAARADGGAETIFGPIDPETKIKEIQTVRGKEFCGTAPLMARVTAKTVEY